MSLIHDKMLRGHGRLSPAKSGSSGAGAAKPRSRVGNTVKPRSAAGRPVVSKEGQRRRRMALLILILLLMIGSFWLGRATFRNPAPLPPAPVLPVAPAPAVIGPAPAQTAPVAAAATVTAIPAATVPASATAAPVARGPETSLLEVSVGTTKRGGLTLKFDHPVSWTVNSPAGSGHAAIDVQGVHALGTFPRNLPLPPGVKAIHAAITAADTLNLSFELRPGIRAYTSPANGPAAVLNVYFRTPIEQAAIESQPQDADDGSAGACGAPASAASIRAAGSLQRSLARDPANADVRGALALLEACGGNGAQAETLMADGMKAGNAAGVRIAVLDAAMLLARGETDAAIQVLKMNAPSKGLDTGYSELLADFEAAAGKP